MRPTWPHLPIEGTASSRTRWPPANGIGTNVTLAAGMLCERSWTHSIRAAVRRARESLLPTTYEYE